MKAPNSYRRLTMLLYVLAAIEGIAGAVLILASTWVISIAIPGATGTPPGFLIFMLKGLGIIGIAFSYLLCVAARDPVRYVAVIYTMAGTLFAAAALQLYSLGLLGLGAIYPTAYLIVRSIVQIVLGVLLLTWLPRRIAPVGTTTEPLSS